MRPAEEADIRWVLAAHAYQGEEVDDGVREAFLEQLATYQEVVMLEDNNRNFGEGYGPVGIVAAMTNGYLYEPHVEWFPWATPRNKLRAAVMFFQKFRYRDLGVVRVHALENAATFFKRLKKYVPLFYVGKIPAGDALGRGDDFIFYMKCRGNYEQHIRRG